MTRLAKGLAGELFDLDAMVREDDKVEECRYFLGLMERETDWSGFRYLTSAFLGAAYSFFEILALRAHCFWDETGEQYASEDMLDRLSPYVSVFKEKKRAESKLEASMR